MVVALLASLTPASASADGYSDEVAAQQAAAGWLRLVDRGDYGSSWMAASKAFRQGVDSIAWAQMVGAVRGPLGAVKSRKLASSQYTTHVPGAPDGQYVVLQYTTVFANKGEAVETITPMLDAGQWRVGGYYVR